MQHNNSPTKRRRSEFHDPDYPTEQEHGHATSSYGKRSREDAPAYISKHEIIQNKLQKIRDVISREFQNEIDLKKQQLETIEERLVEAHNLLDQLRYGIISKYYQKQQIPLTKMEADRIRGATLFDEESSGVQLPIHPALKMVIGKRPVSNTELLNRTCRERTAAQNARQTIRARSTTQRREEKRLQQLIRSKGIVIDHSKEEETTCNDEAAVQKVLEQPQQTSRAEIQISGKALNAPRLNNKEKHMIVVANTSQYIGNEVENHETKSNGLPTMYKWLLYVQCEDVKKNIGDYVKKVRFYLHHSFRPNDVIDVCAPPFQIARRGWGEFPMRIQLFFHEKYQQKPIQLIHNLALDKTLSGLHILGAETLVEIWLRAIKVTPDTLPLPAAHQTQDAMVIVKNEHNNKSRTVSITHNKEELEDDLFDNINKIDEDITKIEPTLVVKEELKCSAKQEPGVIKPIPEPQIRHTNCNTNLNPSNATPAATTATYNSAVMQSNPRTFFIPKSLILPVKSNNNNIATNVNITSTANNLISSKTQIVAQKTNTTNKTLEVVSGTSNKTSGSIGVAQILGKAPSATSTPANQDISKKCLQKKLVQLVDSEGKIKYVQMLVATSAWKKSDTSSSLTPVTHSNATAATVKVLPKLLTLSSPGDNTVQNVKRVTATTVPGSVMSGSLAIPLRPNAMATINQAQLPKMNNENTNKNAIATQQHTKKFVFQKEGKLYFIDPLQMKLKQEQRKQVSLLKPQVNLLRQQQALTSKAAPSKELPIVPGDHDYAPKPTPTTGLVANAYNQQIVRFGRHEMKELKQQKQYEKQQKRMKFENQFYAKEFESMRSAVEYLQRRVAIIATDHTSDLGLPFVSETLAAFQKLTAFKQRSFVWLRAKYIARLIRQHAALKALHNTGKDPFWSTREIAIFARHYDWTPQIKSLLHKDGVEEDNKSLLAFVKSELKQETCETLSSNERVARWMETLCQQLQHHETKQIESDLIDIDDSATNKLNVAHAAPRHISQSKIPGDTHNAGGHSKKLFLRAPVYLENAIQLATDICQNISVSVRPEEIVTNIFCSATTIVLAQCLRIFTEKLLRESLAYKRRSAGNNQNSTSHTCENVFVTTHDICMAITALEEYDFLGNSHLGITKIEDIE